MKFNADTVYLVESSEDDSVLLAMDAKFTGAFVEWFDTARDRAFEVVSSNDTEDALTVQTDVAAYTFRRLSLDLYKLKVAEKVVGQPSFTSTDELQAYYRDYVR